MKLEDRTLLVTGATGQVAFPITEALARDNRVIAVGRFAKEEDRARIEATGAELLVADLTGDLDALPEDPDAVLHFAVVRSGKPDFDGDLTMNAEGAGRLLARCQRAGAFLHCSTAGVYQAHHGEPRAEGDPLGDPPPRDDADLQHREDRGPRGRRSLRRATVRSVPTTIARLGVPYGDAGGWPWFHLMMMKQGVPIPVHAEGPNRFPLLHEDDIVAQLPGLLAAASVPRDDPQLGRPRGHLDRGVVRVALGAHGARGQARAERCRARAAPARPHAPCTSTWLRARSTGRTASGAWSPRATPELLQETSA